MQMETMLTYLAALALPLWLAVEQVMAWWVAREGASRPVEPAKAAGASASRTSMGDVLADSAGARQLPPRAA